MSTPFGCLQPVAVLTMPDRWFQHYSLSIGNLVSDIDLRKQKERELSLCLLVVKVLGLPVLKTNRIMTLTPLVYINALKCAEATCASPHTDGAIKHTTPQTSTLQCPC